MEIVVESEVIVRPVPGFLGFHDVECEVCGGLVTATRRGFAQNAKSGEDVFRKTPLRIVSLPMRFMREAERRKMTRFFPVTEVF
jgi:hypothetical protein